MLRMVDLPQPEGPTMATNSRSWTSKETSETAGTSRGPWPKVFERLRIETRTRGATTGRLLVLRLRLLHEAHVDRLRVRDRLVDRQGHPHFHPALVVLLLDDEVPVEDRPVVAHRLEHHLALEGVHVRLPEEIGHFVVLRPANPLLGVVARVDVGLDEIGRLLDGLLQGVAHRDRDGPAEDAVPRLLVLDVVERLAEAFLHRRRLPLRHRHDRVELAGL